MRCPNRKCKRETRKIIVKFDERGKKYEGCPDCISQLYEPHVYTGRKFWGGDEVYGVEGNKEKAHQFEQSLAERAAMNRRRPPMNEATKEAIKRAVGR